MKNNKSKICFVVSSVLTSKFFLRFHIDKLAKNYDVYLVGNFSDDDIDDISYFKTKGIKSIPIERKINIYKDLIALRLLVLYFKEMDFDVIHSLTPKAGLLSSVAGKFVGVKNRIHIFTGQVWHTKKGFYKILLKNMDRIIVLFNTHILVDSKAQQEYLINNNIVCKRKSHVLGKGSVSGVDLTRFKQNDVLKEYFRKELNIEKNDIVFLYLGRINEDKGIFDLANAFKNLLEDVNNIFLLIVGYDEDNYIERIKEIVNNPKKIYYYGASDKPEKIINVGDIFCLPSYREGFGTSIIEASASKLAVICSSTYGLKDAIIEDKTGLRHQVGDDISLYEKMKFFIDNPFLIKTFGENGFEYVKNFFSADTITEHWLQFYAKILK